MPINQNADLLTQIIMNRGYEDNVESEYILDASILPNIDNLKNAIIDTKLNNKKIGIFGDYDADGLTSTFMWQSVFKAINIDYIHYIPNRCDGYGPSDKGLARLINVDLILFLDCGSNSKELIEKIDKPVFIIDHHQITTPPNNAYIINPFLSSFHADDIIYYQQCCTAGLSFFILLYLCKFLNLNKDYILSLSIYACIGTIADVMHLNKYNKYIIKYGINLLNKDNSNIKYLAQRLKITEITSSSLNFGLIPCINAAGRISDADIILDFFKTTDLDKRDELINILITLNNQRKTLEEETILHAMSIIDISKNCIIAKNNKWHAGIVGVIAGRLKTNLSKATFVFYKADTLWKGSARGANVGNIIQQTIQLGLAHSGGGHHAAGGIAIEESKFDSWQEWVETNYIQENESINIDAISTENALLNPDNFNKLNSFGPFGPGNPQFKILLQNAWIIKITPYNQHLRITLSSGRNFFAFKTDYWGGGFKKGMCCNLLFSIDNTSLIIDDAKKIL